MAWIDKRQTSKGEVRYLVGWREPETGRRVHESFHRMEDAKRRKREVESQLDDGRYTAKADREIPLGTFIEDTLRFEESHGTISSSSAHHYRSMSRLYLSRPWVHKEGERPRPALADRPIGEITTTELERFFGSLAASKQAVYTLLAKAFNKAVAKHVLVHSPLEAIPRPKSDRPEPVIMTKPEIEELAEVADPRYRTAILVGGYVGLRAGEIGGLRAQDVFKENGYTRLFIRQQAKNLDGKRSIGPVKTKASRRKVPIAPWLAREIADHIEKFGTAEDGRIFTTNGDRGPLTHIELNRAIKTAAKRVGMNPAPSPHDLRHSAASILIRDKANPKQVQRFLGHSSIGVTMDTYVDLWPDGLDELADSMERRSEVTAGPLVLALAEASEG